MDFFAREDRARATTRRLLVLFTLCVVAMVLMLGVATWQLATIDERLLPLRLELTVCVVLGTMAAILIASAWKSATLASGGDAVAAMIGARVLSPDPKDPLERTLHHVVEEMSIASGTPLPSIHVLDEPAINAFAAGHSTSDAAIVVSRGALERLSRDELQGVVAHEFSHLLNGDTRLNLRLISLAFGLLVIAMAGRLLISNINLVAAGRSSRSDRKGGAAGLVFTILAVGVTLMVIGYIGWFFAQLLKAGVSRQREYLADASAVQFTRNPAGIGGALKKIGHHSYRSLVDQQRAVELSHLFFADAVPVPLFGLLATHPPLEARIRAIDPRWDGTWTDVAPIHPAPAPPPATMDSGQHGAAALAGVLTIAGRFGRITPDHVAFSAALLSSLPETLIVSARIPFSARAIALLAVVEAAGDRAPAQLQAITAVDAALGAECARLWPMVQPLGDGARLPLLNLCTPSLRQLSDQQRQDFIELERRVAERAGETPLAEYILGRLLRARLVPPSAAHGGGVMALAPLRTPLALVLSELAWAGAQDQAQAEQAFAIAVGRLGEDESLPMAAARASVAQLDDAFDQLQQAGAGLKRRILNACAYCTCADGVVNVSEAELLRAIADSFGCPLPPFLDSQMAPAASS